MKDKSENWKKKLLGRIFCCVASTRQLSAVPRWHLYFCSFVANFLTAIPFCCLYIPCFPPFPFSFSLLHRHIDAFSLFSYPFLILSWLSLNSSISISIQINPLFVISYFLLLCPSFTIYFYNFPITAINTVWYFIFFWIVFPKIFPLWLDHGIYKRVRWFFFVLILLIKIVSRLNITFFYVNV